MDKPDTYGLIRSLTHDLPSVQTQTNLIFPLISWFIVSWLYVVSVALQLGPLRNGSIQALIDSLHFAIESGLGVLVGGVFAYLALRESIPGLRNHWLQKLIFVAAVVWVGNYIVALFWPALNPSMLGKRAHCVLEAYLYSVPPLLIGHLLIAHRYALRSVRAGIYMGISAGAIPALLMQFACMYMPAHTLTHHIGPVVPVALIGAVLGWLSNKRSQKNRPL